MGDFVLRNSDLNMLFVFGFTYLIGAINIEWGIRYICFMGSGSFFLILYNGFSRRRARKLMMAKEALN
jgi:hypothetical protein